MEARREALPASRGRRDPRRHPSRDRLISATGTSRLALAALLLCAPGCRSTASVAGDDAFADGVPVLPAAFERGMNLEPIGGFGPSLDLDRLPVAYDELLGLGVEHVALIPSFFQRRLGDDELYWRRDRERVDADTREAIRLAHARGLGVLLKPHLWLEDRSDGAWRGDILPGEEAWPAWRDAYREAVLAYARLGAEEGVAAISIGSELTELALARPDFWRQLAADVRDVFPGTVTYAANWDREFAEIAWWDAMDVVGVDAFWPLLDSADQTPGPTVLRERLASIRAELAELSRRTGRPVLLTEIGYRSAAGSAWRPWEWHADGEAVADPQLQAAIYAAIADSLSPGAREGWLRGAYFWVWNTNPVWGGPGNSDFTPRDKPAAGVLAAWFGVR